MNTLKPWLQKGGYSDRSLMQPLMKFFNLHTLGAPVRLLCTAVSGRPERAVSGVTVPCKLSKLPEQGLWGNVEGLGCGKEKCNNSGFDLFSVDTQSSQTSHW